jgi:hypothetical protein
LKDIYLYYALQLGRAVQLSSPAIIAPVFFRRSRLSSVLSGVAAAVALPLVAVYRDAHYYNVVGMEWFDVSPQGDARLLALATLIGVVLGHLIYAAELMRSVTPLFISSSVVALAGLNQFLFTWPIAVPTTIRMFGPAAIWLMLLIVAIQGYGKGGLWLLVASPSASFLPLMFCISALA